MMFVYISKTWFQGLLKKVFLGGKTNKRFVCFLKRFACISKGQKKDCDYKF